LPGEGDELLLVEAQDELESGGEHRCVFGEGGRKCFCAQENQFHVQVVGFEFVDEEVHLPLG